MGYRSKLFAHRDPYDAAHTDGLFLEAVVQNIRFHSANCPAYADILRREAFEVGSLRCMDDLWRIPVLPTLYLKQHPLYSMREERFVIKAASSGTSGLQSFVGIDRKSFFYGLQMVCRVFSRHGLLSLRPTNYIVLGYRRKKGDPMGTAQTMYGTTFLAPALARAYALKQVNGSFGVDEEGVQRALYSYTKQGLPVRLVGLPAYMHFLANALHANGVRLRLNKHSRVLLGGGWKRLSPAPDQKRELYCLLEETLGIRADQCFEFFSAVEHPVAYCACKNGHFHTPIYSRVVIRDAKTLHSLPRGQAGLLSFITPLLESMPLVSVMTDDIAISHDGSSCGCGISTPYFELLGRAGLQGVKTCAAHAMQVLGGSDA